MSTPSIEEALRTLTKTEAKVLYYKCLGLRRWEIAAEIQYGEDMVQVHMSNVYRKLGFDASMHWQERKKLLEQDYCPVLSKMVPDPQELEYWPPDLPEIKPDNKALILVMQDDIEEEREYREEQERRELEKIPQAVIKITPPSQPPPPHRLRRGWILLLIFVLILAAVAYWVSQNISTLISILNPEQTQEVAEIVPTDLPSIEPDDISLTKTPLAEASDTPFIEPSLTNTFTWEPPTVSPSITFTPTDTPSPTPAPVVLFEDNFENGQLPDWEIPDGQGGEPFYTEGRLTLTGDLWMYVGSPDWTDYQVRIDCYIPGIGATEVEPNMFAIRVVDSNNMVALHQSGWIVQWVIIENGVKKPVPGTEREGASDVSVIIVTVHDNVYSYSIDAREGPDLNTDKFPKGRVGMWLRSGTEITNFKVVQLP